MSDRSDKRTRDATMTGDTGAFVVRNNVAGEPPPPFPWDDGSLVPPPVTGNPEAVVAPRPLEQNTLAELLRFTFQGDPLDVVRDGDNLLVGVGAICRGLGIAYEAQIRKLKSDSSVGVIMMITPSGGGAQETMCLPLRALPLWLATIHERKVKPAARAKLAAYKKEAAEALADHFLGKRGAGPVLPPGMRTVLETWTPGRAAETLTRRDPRSRPIAPKTVDKYARDMASNRWAYNPHGIVLGPAGEPIDGNHRLTALVNACVPVAFLTTYISDPALALDIKLKIDTGRARSVGDILELTEGVRSGNHRAAIAVALDLLESGTTRPLSVAQTRDVIARYRDAIEWAMVALASGEFNAPIRAAFVYARTAHRAASRSTEPIDALVHLVRCGAGEIGSPSAMYAVAAKAGRFRAGRERRAVILRVLRILKAQVCGEAGPAKLYARTRGRIVGEGEIDADGIGFAYFRSLLASAAAPPVLPSPAPQPKNPWLAAFEAIGTKVVP